MKLPKSPPRFSSSRRFYRFLIDKSLDLQNMFIVHFNQILFIFFQVIYLILSLFKSFFHFWKRCFLMTSKFLIFNKLFKCYNYAFVGLSYPNASTFFQKLPVHQTLILCFPSTIMWKFAELIQYETSHIPHYLLILPSTLYLHPICFQFTSLCFQISSTIFYLFPNHS